MSSTNGVKPSPFTMDNIPFGVISTADNPERRCASAYEDNVIDLSVLEKNGFFDVIAGFEGAIFQSVCNLFDGDPINQIPNWAE